MQRTCLYVGSFVLAACCAAAAGDDLVSRALGLMNGFFIEDESPVVLQQIPTSLKFLSSVAF